MIKNGVKLKQMQIAHVCFSSHHQYQRCLKIVINVK